MKQLHVADAVSCKLMHTAPCILVCRNQLCAVCVCCLVCLEVYAVCCVVPAPSPLQVDLRGNGLGNDGAIRISRGLRSHQNPKLAELDLGYNEIKDDGACALAQVGRRRLCVGSGGGC